MEEKGKRSPKRERKAKKFVLPFGPTVSDAARILGISPGLLYKWVRDGEVPEEAVRRKGRNIYISWEWLEEMRAKLRRMEE